MPYKQCDCGEFVGPRTKQCPHCDAEFVYKTSNPSGAPLGRPPKYVGALKDHIVEVCHDYTLSDVRTILNADRRTIEGKMRDTKLVPKPLGISMPTLSKIAKEAGIDIRPGRYPTTDAA